MNAGEDDDEFPTFSTIMSPCKLPSFPLNKANPNQQTNAVEESTTSSIQNSSTSFSFTAVNSSNNSNNNNNSSINLKKQISQDIILLDEDDDDDGQEEEEEEGKVEEKDKDKDKETNNTMISNSDQHSSSHSDSDPATMMMMTVEEERSSHSDAPTMMVVEERASHQDRSAAENVEMTSTESSNNVVQKGNIEDDTSSSSSSSSSSSDGNDSSDSSDSDSDSSSSSSDNDNDSQKSTDSTLTSASVSASASNSTSESAATPMIVEPSTSSSAAVVENNSTDQNNTNQQSNEMMVDESGAAAKNTTEESNANVQQQHSTNPDNNNNNNTSNTNPENNNQTNPDNAANNISNNTNNNSDNNTSSDNSNNRSHHENDSNNSNDNDNDNDNNSESENDDDSDNSNSLAPAHAIYEKAKEMTNAEDASEHVRKIWRMRRNPETLWSPLHVAADKNDRETTLKLLKVGVSPFMGDSQLNTPLHIACAAKAYSVIEALAEISSQYSPSLLSRKKKEKNQTPICALVNAEDIEGLKTVLKYATMSDINEKCTNGGTALHSACDLVSPQAAEIITMLIQAGADVNATSSLNTNPIHHAARTQLKSVQLLLNANADVNVRAKGFTALYFASEKGNADIVEALLQNGADPTILNETGWDPLHVAAARNKPKVIEALLKCKAVNIELLTTNLTPLQMACLMGSTEAALVLLDHGANPFVKSDKGDLLNICKTQTKPVIEEYLKSKKLLDSSSSQPQTQTQPQQPPPQQQQPQQPPQQPSQPQPQTQSQPQRVPSVAQPQQRHQLASTTQHASQESLASLKQKMLIQQQLQKPKPAPPKPVGVNIALANINKSSSTSNSPSPSPIPIPIPSTGNSSSNGSSSSTTTTTTTTTTNMVASTSNPNPIIVMKPSVIKVAFTDLNSMEAAFDTKHIALAETETHRVFGGHFVGLPVLIKKFKTLGGGPPTPRQKSKFMTDVSVLSLLRHPSLSLLIAYACEDIFGFAVIEESPTQGSLSAHISQGSELVASWKSRIAMAFDIAVALHYLHHALLNTPVLHLNLCLDTITIDELGRAKLSDFGLFPPQPYPPYFDAQLKANPEAAAIQAATPRFKADQGALYENRHFWLPVDYLTSGYASRSVDVYSFGSLLADLILKPQSFVSLSKRDAVSALCLLLPKIRETILEFSKDGPASQTLLEAYETSTLTSMLDTPFLVSPITKFVALSFLSLVNECCNLASTVRPTTSEILQSLASTLRINESVGDTFQQRIHLLQLALEPRSVRAPAPDCLVCSTGFISIRAFPCYHLYACQKCVPALSATAEQRCLVCREVVAYFESV